MSSRRTLWFVASGAAVMALSGYVGFTYGVGKQPAPVRGAEAERAPVARSLDAERLAALERTVHALRSASTEQRSATSAPADSQSVAERSADADGDPPPVDPEVEKAEVAAMLQNLDDRLDTEPIDPRWRAESERELAESVPRDMGPEVTLTEAKCASTLCRAELTHPALTKLPIDRIQTFARNTYGQKPTELKFSFGEGKTTVYAIRRTDFKTAAN